MTATDPGTDERRSATPDEGTGYGLHPGTFDEELVRVGPGTPGGEMLRRYWQPFATTDELTTTPMRIRLLGEDLVAFRTDAGEPGLVVARCCHRGTTLFFGKVDDQGIRCCYHGWLFAPDGRCLDMPCEPDRGRQRERYRQPWYPVRERYGLMWTYMGPPDGKPALPRYDFLEDLPADRVLVAVRMNPTNGGPVVVGCNWLQMYENMMDPYHAAILHSSFTEAQFGARMAVMPEISWSFTEHGVISHQYRVISDDEAIMRVSEVMMPNVTSIADPYLDTLERSTQVSWFSPCDDESTTSFMVMVAEPGFDPTPVLEGIRYPGDRTWHELTDAERQRWPNDFEAQTGQGVISFHDHENLAASDRGVVMMRTLLRRAIREVAAGGTPINTWVEPDDAVVAMRAGNWVADSATRQPLHGPRLPLDA